MVRMKTVSIAVALALVVPALTLRAQDAGGPPPHQGGQQGGHQLGQQGGPGGEQGGPGGGERRRFMPPIIAALDANSDGVIDEQEIANASAALKKLDKNGDGKITREEMMPPRPQGGQQGQGGQFGGRRGNHEGQSGQGQGGGHQRPAQE
jgi:hypothetical protein